MPSQKPLPTDDQRLVNKFLSTRNEHSFRQLYRRHTPNLYPLALRLAGGSETDAHDALQEMWIRACNKLHRFEWKSSLRTWLTGILINCVREATREFQKRREDELPEEYEGAGVQPSLTGIDLDQLISRLPPGYRHVLTLHDIEGYTHEEIGAFLNINAGTSKNQLFHARQVLRSMLREESLAK
ncbi:MAG TPA: RNA polymerase sigma factor [Pyrinomonadaceae bacterium]|nr:RNA polymerase sigma factor [Pyrinomonadaceae bacterium]